MIEAKDSAEGEEMDDTKQKKQFYVALKSVLYYSFPHTNENSISGFLAIRRGHMIRPINCEQNFKVLLLGGSSEKLFHYFPVLGYFQCPEGTT